MISINTDLLNFNYTCVFLISRAFTVLGLCFLGFIGDMVLKELLVVGNEQGYCGVCLALSNPSKG